MFTVILFLVVLLMMAFCRAKYSHKEKTYIFRNVKLLFHTYDDLHKLKIIIVSLCYVLIY